jgi:type II secretory pathway pseudopilin PulG
MHSSSRCGGFSVIEALIAAALVASALVGLAHLVALGAERARASRYSAGALAAAQSKLEELRGAALAYDADGTRLNAAVLSPSPPASLNEDTAGYVDFLDAFGQNVSSEPGDVVTDYVRRWSVTPFAAGDLDTFVLRACVFTTWNRRFANPVPEVCVISIRTRTS